jgi:hypothetical protein
MKFKGMLENSFVFVVIKFEKSKKFRNFLKRFLRKSEKTREISKKFSGKCEKKRGEKVDLVCK